MRIWAKNNKKQKTPRHEELTFFGVFNDEPQIYANFAALCLGYEGSRDVAKVTDMVGRISVEPGTDLVDLPGGSVGFERLS